VSGALLVGVRCGGVEVEYGRGMVEGGGCSTVSVGAGGEGGEENGDVEAREFLVNKAINNSRQT
jgi:hypothetical protein